MSSGQTWAGYFTVELFSSGGDLLLETQVSGDLLPDPDELDAEEVAEFAENFANGVRAGSKTAENIGEV